MRCNQHKGPNIAGIDPTTGKLSRLFHPRRDPWAEHFNYDGPVLVGKTSKGRATIAVLAINHPLRVATRRGLLAEGVDFE